MHSHENARSLYFLSKILGICALLLSNANGHMLSASLSTSYITIETELIEKNNDYEKLSDAIQSVASFGVDVSSLCHPTSNIYLPLISICDNHKYNIAKKNDQVHHDAKFPFYMSQMSPRITTDLTDTNETNSGSEEEDEEKDIYFILFNLMMVSICVTFAALAAGLTMGLLSLDKLELEIKERASSSNTEKNQCKRILPIIRDHHRLLVTLLLVNAIANEALPLFLDELVPSYLAVIISVTLVLFFGEIIPSAIFTGPKQLSMASFMVPFLKIFLWLLTPLAWPIAKLLDALLGHEDEDEKFDRNELAALVEIMYSRRKNKSNPRNPMLTSSFRQGSNTNLITSESSMPMPPSLLKDEVTIVSGVLQMRVQTAGKVCTKWESVQLEEKSTVLNKETIQRLSDGHSRIPIYDKNAISSGSAQDRTKTICGILHVRDLLLINPNDRKKISDIPLQKPTCIASDMNLADALNKLQHGKPLALVCKKADKAAEALKKNVSVPMEAGVLGLITLEDVFEDIIQEEIYDEYDENDSDNLEGPSRLFNRPGSDKNSYSSINQVV